MIRQAFAKLIALASAGVFAFAALTAPVEAFGQAATWNYTAPGNVSTATYPGNVVINGTCTGCGGGAQLNVANTWTALQTFSAGAAISSGSATFTSSTGTNSSLRMSSVAELFNSLSSPGATVNYDSVLYNVYYYAANATTNWTLNVRGDAVNSFNAVASSGRATTIVLITTQGATPYYNNVFQIDGVGQTVKWQGGTAPAAGNANGLDVYTFTILKTASATYTVLGSLVQFK